MSPGLLSDPISMGYEIFLEGDNIRYRYHKLDRPPELARLLIYRLKKYKTEAVAILKKGDVVTPTDQPPQQLNVNTSWPPDVQSLIDWFMGLEPPAEPFHIEPHMKVIDPEKYFAKLRREIKTGPLGPRARTGALQWDLRNLKCIFELNRGI